MRILAICILLFLLFPWCQQEPDRVIPPLKSPDEIDAWLFDPKKPKVVLHPLPKVVPPEEKPLSPEQTKRISALIAQLADISDSDYGLSSTMSGTAFAPIPGSEEASAMLLTPHNLKQSKALLELVKIGPPALPLLLKHLDDSTETHLTLYHNGGFGDMEFSQELDFNEANPTESKAVEAETV